MQEILDFADANSRITTLVPSTEFGGNLAGLRRFYSRLGFKPNRGANKIKNSSLTGYGWVRLPQS